MDRNAFFRTYAAYSSAVQNDGSYAPEDIFRGEDVFSLIGQDGVEDVPNGFSGIICITLPEADPFDGAGTPVVLDLGSDALYFMRYAGAVPPEGAYRVALLSGSLIFSDCGRRFASADTWGASTEVRMDAFGDSAVFSDAGIVDLYDSAHAEGSPGILRMRNSSSARVSDCGMLLVNAMFDEGRPEADVSGSAGYIRVQGGVVHVGSVDSADIPVSCAGGPSGAAVLDAGSIGRIVSCGDDASVVTDYAEEAVILGGIFEAAAAGSVRGSGNAQIGICGKCRELLLSGDAKLYISAEADIEDFTDRSSHADEYLSEEVLEAIRAAQMAAGRSLPSGGEDLLRAYGEDAVPDISGGRIHGDPEGSGRKEGV